MTTLDDWLPEEREEPLIPLLQRAYSASAAVPPDRQAQIITRVQERLPKMASETPLNQTMPGQLREAIDSSPRTAISLAASPRRRGRFVRLSTLLAAVLVIGVLVGTSLLISLSPPRTTGTPATPTGSVEKPGTIQTQAGGLEATLQVTPGPYFLGELLEVDLSLTNHSKTTFQGDRCHLYPMLIVIDGEGVRDTNLASAADTTIYRDQYTVKIFPHDTNLAHLPPITFPPDFLSECSPAPFNVVSLQPGKTVTVQRYIALTSSGHVTLAERATFQKVVHGANGGIKLVPTASPRDGHWPSLQVSVGTRVPLNRTLSSRQQTTQLVVSVPTAARGYLLYAYEYACGLGKVVSESGGEFRADHKITQPSMTLQKPQCDSQYPYFGSTPAKLLRWSYVIGVPGYAMLWGNHP